MLIEQLYLPGILNQPYRLRGWLETIIFKLFHEMKGNANDECLNLLLRLINLFETQILLGISFNEQYEVY